LKKASNAVQDYAQVDGGVKAVIDSVKIGLSTVSAQTLNVKKAFEDLKTL